MRAVRVVEVEQLLVADRRPVRGRPAGLFEGFAKPITDDAMVDAGSAPLLQVRVRHRHGQWSAKGLPELLPKISRGEPVAALLLRGIFAPWGEIGCCDCYYKDTASSRFLAEGVHIGEHGVIQWVVVVKPSDRRLRQGTFSGSTRTSFEWPISICTQS